MAAASLAMDAALYHWDQTKTETVDSEDLGRIIDHQNDNRCFPELFNQLDVGNLRDIIGSRNHRCADEIPFDLFEQSR